MSDSAFKRAVALLAVLRAVPPIIVLVANGRSVPALPSYSYGPPIGDTYAFYAAAREFISVWTQISKPLVGATLVVFAAGSIAAVMLWRRGRPAEAVVAAAAALGTSLSIGIQGMHVTGAGAVGWPLVWTVPLLPLRAAGVLGYHAAYYLGISILILCNVVTLVATALIARRLVPGPIALLAPSLLVAWPFLMTLVQGWPLDVQGSWVNDTGLGLYSEPLSTALVAAALALLILGRSEPHWVALAGALLGFATVVRISNITIVAVVILGVFVATSRRSAVFFTLACGALLLVGVVYWPLGYSTFEAYGDPRIDHPLSVHNVVQSWRDSQVFDWKMVLILLPLPVLGVWRLRRLRFEACLLAGVVVATAVFYSFYSFTSLHPRFLFVALPPLFVLAAAGAEALAGYAHRPRTTRAILRS